MGRRRPGVDGGGVRDYSIQGEPEEASMAEQDTVTRDAGQPSAAKPAHAKAKKTVHTEAVYDIPVKVSTVLGKSSIRVSHLLKLGRGAVIELDRKVGEPIDVYVNDRLVARGELIVVDGRLGVTMTEIIRRSLND